MRMRFFFFFSLGGGGGEGRLCLIPPPGTRVAQSGTEWHRVAQSGTEWHRRLFGIFIDTYIRSVAEKAGKFWLIYDFNVLGARFQHTIPTNIWGINFNRRKEEMDGWMDEE